ncbi:hypothetical protein BY996DRAFT_4589766 [Phakopsora pachyrhizi]|uniref:Homoaconitase, mitochondrial n=1 Tax=Phakopsora pachyrhizi TaxID=170000 RepID=A0AAV0AWE2_PHAPC|nr:hypothetical protein BY996DRAFT_4589766 [Phakopsora pachyrhizi]CAH7672932.1 hypothetical protein PPACK8108_LOCUS7771 [Phakopsora pachyrhizi]
MFPITRNRYQPISRLTTKSCVRCFNSSTPVRAQTFIEKVVQKHSVDHVHQRSIRSGDFVMLRPEHVMTHDNTAPVISKFKSIGVSKISNSRQPVFAIDHDVQNKSDSNLRKYSNIERFAHSHNIDFYPPGRGIGHQVMIEEGYAFPGVLMVASDSHSNMYGGIGCVGTPVVRTDAAAIWATERTWWQVPEIVKVQLTGSLRPGVTGKDVIVALCGSFNRDEVLNAAIEFAGEGLKSLSVDDRLAISNMTTEWGALAGVFPIDDVLIDWYHNLLGKRAKSKFINSRSIPSPIEDHPRLSGERIDSIKRLATDLSSDPDANYSKTLTLDLSSLVPHVSGPNSVKLSTPINVLESQRIPINKAYLVSCVNSRASDLEAAAEVIKGRSIAPGVEFYVAAASSVVQAQSEASGHWSKLIEAGAKVLPAGCGPCIGLGTGLLKDGEIGISATNRNYKGRMGSPNAQAYLASPAVVAASAINGFISGPSRCHSEDSNTPKIVINYNRKNMKDKETECGGVLDQEELLESFPKKFTGPVIFAPCDNINTDGIYPGKYTYQDDITADQQAKVVMENYDPEFSAKVDKLWNKFIEPQDGGSKLLEGLKEDESRTVRSVESSKTGRGVILVSGSNFGTGSSREQAATSLKNSGIVLVICKTFSETFKRNSINNGLICIESEEFVKKLEDQQKRTTDESRGEKSVEVEETVEFDCEKGVISQGGEQFRCGFLGRSVQEIFVCGGLEGWVREKTKSKET